MCSSVRVSIWISRHSYDNDNEIVSELGTSLVATCATGSSLDVAGVLAGTIWTWQTMFLVILFCYSMLLMETKFPIFRLEYLLGPWWSGGSLVQTPIGCAQCRVSQRLAFVATAFFG